MKLLTAAIALTLLCTTVQAEVYKTTDKYGNVIYTDKPPKSTPKDSQTEKVEVRPTNVMPSERGSGFKPDNNRDKEDEAPPDYGVRIVSPKNEATVPPGQRDLVIAVATRLGLDDDTQFVYYMDGNELGRSQNNNYSIKEINRGEHQLRVDVVKNGEVLDSSNSVTVYVHRASKLNRNGEPAPTTGVAGFPSAQPSTSTSGGVPSSGASAPSGNGFPAPFAGASTKNVQD